MSAVNSIKKFWKEVMLEMKKVSWPSRKQSWDSMIVVLVVLGLFTVACGLVDGAFNWIMGFVYGISI